MVTFNQLSLSASASVAILLFFNTSASAISAPISFVSRRHETHRVREIYGFEMTSYHPATKYETFVNGGDDLPLSKRGDSSFKEAATAWVQNRLATNDRGVLWRSGFDGSLCNFAYFRQSVNGIPVANAVANLAVMNNKVVSFGNNFVTPKTVAPTNITIPATTAINTAEENLGATYNGHPVSLEYFAKDDGSLVLTHIVQVDSGDHWYEAYINAHTGEFVNIVDFVAEAVYRVVPIEKKSPEDGFEILVNPEDLLASPSGWHSDGTNNGSTTSGNNAFSFKTRTSGVTAQSSGGLNFVFNYNLRQNPTAAQNLNAARTNAFYVVNTMHDIFYRYGFTESAFNFQLNNFGKGGRANDPVLISVQDASGFNNANFATPADGQSGRMRMFLWTQTTPQRDGAVENDIIVHGMTHGLTNRLTGGGTGRCLTSNEAGGLGEGWSDAVADWTEQTTAPIKDFVMGNFVLGTTGTSGIRSFPYSIDAKVNPLTYGTTATLREVHDIGEVWANMLHNVLGALVDAHGLDTNAKIDPTSTAGNAVFMHLLIDRLALQPCNPTFLTARDAIIQADANRFGGANECILRKAFAGKGLGLNADATKRDNFDTPAKC